MSSYNLPTLRRIVASHNEQGKSTVKSDTEWVSKVLPLVDGGRGGPIWSFVDGLPTKDNHDSSDEGAKRVLDPAFNFGLVPPKGCNLCITELAPGATAAMHRTSSLDYDILLEGELTLIMEDGSETTLKQVGDIVVMKGAIHAWKNPSSTKWCRWIAVLLSAEPVEVDGKALGPEHRP